MPYINQETREDLDFNIKEAQSSGELCYEVHVMVLQYLKRKGYSYQTFADIIAALETSKREVIRNYMEPYEDVKREENGEVCSMPSLPSSETSENTAPQLPPGMPGMWYPGLVFDC